MNGQKIDVDLSMHTSIMMSQDLIHQLIVDKNGPTRASFDSSLLAMAISGQSCNFYDRNLQLLSPTH